MGAYDTSLGAPLIGTWFNTMLYVWELTQIHHYANNYPLDRLLIKITVASTFLFDSAASVGGYILVYSNTVSHWGDKEYLLKQPWALSLCAIATGASAAITQTFLVYRYWRLTNHITLSVIILILVLVSMAGAALASVTLIISPPYTGRFRHSWTGSLWFISSVVVDLITAIVLLIQFIRMDASFNSTKRLLQRLVALTIRTGTVTALWAMGIVAAFWVLPEGNVSVGLGICMGRVYTLTLLFNLNIRHSLRRHDPMIDAESIHLEEVISSANANEDENASADSSTPLNLAKSKIQSSCG